MRKAATQRQVAPVAGVGMGVGRIGATASSVECVRQRAVDAPGPGGPILRLGPGAGASTGSGGDHAHLVISMGRMNSLSSWSRM